MRFRLVPVFVAVGLSVSAVFGQELEPRRIFGVNETLSVNSRAYAGLSTAEISSGLEAYDYQKVYVEVVAIPEALTEIGLTQQRVRTRVELRLRAVNLTPLSSDELPELLRAPEFLHIVISGIGRAFSVEVRLVREGYYFDPESDSDNNYRVLRKYVPFWTTNTIGTHGDDPGYILDALDEKVDEFLNEYLAANQP